MATSYLPSLSLLCVLVGFSLVTAQSLPTVDLGYQVQQASTFNSTGQYYNFSNIRFAQPPLGELRWAPPVSPTGRNTTVNDGNSFGPICPQANPAWSGIGADFIVAFAEGNASRFNYSQAAAQTASAAATPMDSRTSEDCLFLDVFAPKSIFDAANSTTGNATNKGAPVLVWIYGGGYTGGSKTSSGNPSGLIKASQVGGSDGVIFVAMNYRLGAFGWLSGSTFSTNGTQNVALYDQRLALEWVQQHISKFGGDPNRVTVMGESAGGGSILHQITAYGGLKPVPFQQAILQSPGFLPVTSSLKEEQTYDTFLQLLNVSTLEEARKLPSQTLINANALQVSAAMYGSYVYGPSVGGSFVPELPGKLLLHGGFAHDLRIMVGHNTYEGVYFTDPRTANQTAEIAYLQSAFPGIQPSAISYILNTLYPANYSGTTLLPYTSPIQRAILPTTEGIFTCNTLYLDRAYANSTYAYQFSVFPAIHGQDISYTFWNGETTDLGILPINGTIATVMQQLFTSFAETGVPSSPQWGGQFGRYTNMDKELDLNTTGIEMMTDPTANERCVWWQKALYY